MKLKTEPVKAKMKSYCEFLSSYRFCSEERNSQRMSGKQLSFETDIGVNTLYTILRGGKCSTKAAARIAVVLRLPLNSIIEA